MQFFPFSESILVLKKYGCLGAKMFYWFLLQLSLRYKRREVKSV